MSGQWINSPTWPVQLSWECHGPWGVRCQPGWCLAFFVVQQWHWRSINSAFQQDVARLYERAAVFLQCMIIWNWNRTFKDFWKSSKMFTFWEECELRCSSLTAVAARSVHYRKVTWDDCSPSIGLAWKQAPASGAQDEYSSSMNSSIRWRQQDMLLMALFFLYVSYLNVHVFPCISNLHLVWLSPISEWLLYGGFLNWWYPQNHGLKPSPWTMGTMGPTKTCICLGYYRPYNIWRITTLPFRGFRVYITKASREAG